ncbi:hypothetical protein, putative hemolysin type calcium binding protein [Sulfurovum sp. enrichment culture clone C5]|uniref:Uncharacterized protein n=1 Tax=Sulfurovum sp. enrichment culture clone C5 TaxID=497650 RepID=A0A0S4XP81_9BACT|nr:hypothetical protein, putative hemolysin type calcium binding protein [Sulfurovum sp. enrichment culture clone C5]
MRGFWNFLGHIVSNNPWFGSIFNRIFNKAPEANNDVATIFEDSSININILGNDIDSNGDKLIISSISSNNGTVSINSDGTLHYVPNENYNGIDTIHYTISDGRGGTSSAEVKVTIEAVNDAPTQITLITNSVYENSAGAKIGDLSTQDVDDTMHIYSVSDDRFEVVDDILKLKDGVSLDYENENSINLDITSTDAAGESVTQSLIINVNDIDESGSGQDDGCQMGYRLIGQYSNQDGGFFQYKYDITYDDKGNIIKTEVDDYGPQYYYDVDGIADTTSEYNYDSNGNIATISTSRFEEISKVENYIYDQNNNLLSKTSDYNADGIMDSTITYTYDNNNVSSMNEYYGENMAIDSTTTYTYDENGNMLAEDRISNFSEHDRTIYAYDENNNIISKNIDIGANGSIESSTTYTYDYEQNGYTQTINYDYGNDGSIDKTASNIYDNNGLLISSNDNYVSAIVTYVYEYGCISQNYEAPYLNYGYVM